MITDAEIERIIAKLRAADLELGDCPVLLDAAELLQRILAERRSKA